MAKSGVIDEITAHRALEGLPNAWVDLAYGRIGREEALERARSQEPEALAERTMRMLTPPTAAESKARMELLLGRLEPERRARRPWIPGGVAVLAAVAAVALVLIVPREPAERPFDAGYELELSEWVASERGPAEPKVGSDDVWTYRVDRPIAIRLRPGSRVVEPVGVRAFAQSGGRAAIVLPIEPAPVDGGVTDIRGLPRDWGLEPGRWRLTLVVGPPDDLPDELADVRMDEAAPYDVQSVQIEITEPAPDIP